MEIRTIGRETFLPSTSFLRILRAMKYSNFNFYTNKLLKYAKHSCLTGILLILVFSCGILNKDNKYQKRRNNEGNHIAVEKNDSKKQDGRKSKRLEGKKSDDKKQPIDFAEHKPVKQNQLLVGSERLNLYVDSLKNKRVAIVGNQTSLVGETHLVDTLLSLGVKVVKVFSPEHGFRGDADAGERVANGKDAKTGLPLISLYGNNKKPKPSQLKDVDVVVFDLQDVGVRFYTYISTLHYIMESCAENNLPLIVLDRPNPNAHYVDGPVRDSKQVSFVGMHPVPVVYGMTIGEYALMINGECWLADSLTCELEIVPCKNYAHKTHYSLPVPPSPNLRSDASIALYPSLCLFEGTTVSVGRGTERPFEVFGHPKFPELEFSFTPVSSFGAKSPLWENKLCYGHDLQDAAKRRLHEFSLNWILEAKELLGDSIPFINQPSFFDRLAGTSELRRQITEGWKEKEIRASWKPGIQAFRKIRVKYLLYD